ncbi:MAG TPA: HmuY family protein [Polyangiaceae bacterium]|nr:HmuY family protein [Polyangiaceae bacterium]
MTRCHTTLGWVALGAFLGACGSDPVKSKPGAPERPGPPPEQTELTFEVSATEPVYLKLATPEVVTVANPKSTTDWDLAFVGYDVLTNGGISGSAAGAAFGPLDVSVFAFPDEPVDVPFWIVDAAGGVFWRWYAYDGSSHALYSRYHVYGLRSADKLYKLQILGYYGDVQGAPVSALYKLRYAEVTPDGSGETQEVTDLDATLDGKDPGPDVRGGCLTLADGRTSALTPNEAKQSLAWDICFQRESISVNGELGGPGDVTGVDLQADDTDEEALALVKKRTAASEAPRFDGTDQAALDALEFHGDGVTSAFTGKWAELGEDPPVPKPGTAFIVRAADGKSRYLVAVDSFAGATRDTPGTVTLTVVPSVSP